jgi:capsular polysaccharide biosynthesis protein
MEVKGVENSIENKPYFSTKNVIFIDEFRERFNKCSKNGGYKKYFGKWVWVNHKIKYFPQNKDGIINWGGVPNFIDRANLVYLENSILHPNKFSDNFRQKYTFYVEQEKSQVYDLESAITFNIGGSNTFQHFMQDCLPIIAKTKKFLLDNPELPMLLPDADMNFKNRDYILDKIGIKNKIIETDQIDTLRIRYLYFWNFTPYNSQYNLPPIFYRALRELIYNQELSVENRTIVLLLRNEKMRKFKNKSEVIECLQLIANLYNLKLVTVDTSVEHISLVRKKIEEALIIIGIHGGNTYNAIFCQNDCSVIEIVPMSNTNTNIIFLSFAGVKYVPFPSNFNFFDEEVNVSVKELEKVVLTVLNSKG